MFPVTEFVKWMNENEYWDKLVKKQAHDAEGNPVEGKYFLSTDTRQNIQNVEIVLGGEKMLTTRLEIPVIIARNVQTPDARASRKATAQAGRILTQASKLDVDTLTPEQKAEAKALLERLSQ